MTWQPPIISNGDITAYIIYYTTSESSQLADWHKILLAGNENNVTIPVKHERTDYFFRVQAATEQGPGIISQPIRVRSGSKGNIGTLKIDNKKVKKLCETFQS
ncbi:hypothetical protein L596_030312 [Steinernema carpocapsae]|uniref:Fibronectin type-III domain-containing protein n=1 Tax=Steinernema carpocapsae TaxID=34508 RepID=A0A4U5LP10_STECR|nr:hypothetical protein L596_030312 [Steinernema carpocapsae]